MKQNYPFRFKHHKKAQDLKQSKSLEKYYYRTEDKELHHKIETLLNEKKRISNNKCN